MGHKRRFDFRQATLHGAVGALAGATFIALFLGFDLLGSGFVLDWAQNSVVHATALLYKPMMLCFVAGLAWSAWRQAEVAAEISQRRARTAPVRARHVASRR